jgi:hypothetical protein
VKTKSHSVYYVSVCFDHHQVCMNEKSKYTTFMLNHITKMDSFFQLHKLKVVYVFRGEYKKR